MKLIGPQELCLAKAISEIPPLSGRLPTTENIQEMTADIGELMIRYQLVIRAPQTMLILF